MKTYVKVLIWVLAAAVLALGAWGIYAFINNGQRNFYVKYGNEQIIGEKTGVELSAGAISVFYPGTITGQKAVYDVQITVNVKAVENFDFKVDGARKNFKNDIAEYDLSELFGVVKFEDCFTVNIPEKLTVNDILENRYSGKSLEGVPDTVLTAADSFILTVVDSVEKQATQIYFSLKYENRD